MRQWAIKLWTIKAARCETVTELEQTLRLAAVALTPSERTKMLGDLLRLPALPTPPPGTSTRQQD